MGTERSRFTPVRGVGTASRALRARGRNTLLKSFNYAASVWQDECRGDRAANVTDCRPVSRGFDSLPRHSGNRCNRRQSPSLYTPYFLLIEHGGLARTQLL